MQVSDTELDTSGQLAAAFIDLANYRYVYEIKVILYKNSSAASVVSPSNGTSTHHVSAQICKNLYTCSSPWLYIWDTLTTPTLVRSIPGYYDRGLARKLSKRRDGGHRWSSGREAVRWTDGIRYQVYNAIELLVLSAFCTALSVTKISVFCRNLSLCFLSSIHLIHLLLHYSLQCLWLVLSCVWRLKWKVKFYTFMIFDLLAAHLAYLIMIYSERVHISWFDQKDISIIV